MKPSPTLRFALPILSAIVAAAVTWFACRKGHETLRHKSPGPIKMGEPADWLLAPGTTLEDIHRGTTAQWILDAPEKITLHERFRGTPDPAAHLIYGHQRDSFLKQGVEVTADEQRGPLLYTIRSISTYANVGMCFFDPVVLIRLWRGDKSLDLLCCFKCGEIRIWCATESEIDSSGGVGLSQQGRRSIIHHLFKSLPSNAVLKKLQQEY